jgi:hypothetical protein
MTLARCAAKRAVWTAPVAGAIVWLGNRASNSLPAECAGKGQSTGGGKRQAIQPAVDRHAGSKRPAFAANPIYVSSLNHCIDVEISSPPAAIRSQKAG